MNPERAAKKASRQKAREERKYSKLSPEAQEFRRLGNMSHIDRIKEIESDKIAEYNKAHGVTNGATISPEIKIGAPQQSVERLDKAEDLGDISQRKVADVHISPVSSAKALDNSASNIKVPVTTPIMKGAFSANGSLPNATTEKTTAQTGVITKTTPEPNKPMTLSDYLSERREALKKEKTDAVKMQKYYALTDALRSLGHMAGAAVGGAIGGNAIDSAPKVDEYKESRGYIDAFERAKQANEKLRALDDKEYDLAYAKQQRDEERAYNEKVRDEERKYRAELMRLESELRQAEKAGDREAEEKFRLKVLELTQAHEEKLKRMSVDMVNTQMAGKKESEVDSIPFTFQNLTKIDIPKNLYPEMLNWALTLGQVGDDYIDADNVETVLRKNPELVNSFLNLYGYGNMPQTPSVETGAQTESNAEPEKKSNPNRTFEEVNKDGIKARKQRNEHRKNNSSYQPLVFGASPSASKDIINLFSSQKEGMQTGSNMSTEDFENKWANK